MNHYLELPLKFYNFDEIKEVLEEDSEFLEAYEDEDLFDYLIARDSGMFDKEEDFKMEGIYEDSPELYDSVLEERYESEWTLEDSWDALTDGMYGDCPSNPIAYDAMMDAMGY